MGLNSEQEKQSLKESLKNTEDLDQTLLCLECILEYKTPMALYIATADQSDCTWIFDADMIYGMVGGKKKYTEIHKTIFSEDSEEEGILFFIFKKVGPLYSVRVDLQTIEEIVEDLKKDF
jgi:hypothetical protein